MRTIIDGNGLVHDGIHHLLDEQVYRKDPAIAISDLKEMGLSPLHFWSKKFGGYRAEKTEAQEIGTLTHLSVLEPNEYAKKTVVRPSDAPRKPTEVQRNAKKPSEDTIAAIKWWDDWNANNAGKTELTQEDVDQIGGITYAVHSNQDAASLMEDALKEVAMFKTIEVNGVTIRVKGKADIICGSKHPTIIADLKTVDRGYANTDDFSYSIRKWGYHQQAAWYIDLYNSLTGVDDPFTTESEKVVKKTDWVFIVAEKLPPYAVITLQLDPAAIEAGRAINRSHLAKLADCFRTNIWEPPLAGNRWSVTLPEWQKRAA